MTAPVLILIPLLITAGYVLLMALLARGWSRLGGSRPLKQTDRVSVIIAARNEAENIGLCLQSIADQHYPRNRFEVLVVDDYSTDQTAATVEEFIRQNPEVDLHLIRQTGRHGKKAAIALALEQARGVYALTTDADCEVSPGWIAAMVMVMESRQAVFVSGPVTFKNPSGIFGKLQDLEFISLVASGAGSIGAGFPLMCNGANMGFSLEAYRSLQVDALRNQTASGDDVFLMLSMLNRFGSDKIAFARCRDALVFTRPAGTPVGFINQRLRWTSKSRAYRYPPLILSAMIVFFMNALLVFSLVAGLFTPRFLMWFLLVYLVKIFADLMVLTGFARFAQKPGLLWLVVPAEPLVAFYTTLVALAGQVVPASWKDRRVRGG